MSNQYSNIKPVDRFWAKVLVPLLPINSNPCWIAKGCRTREGYVWIKWNGKQSKMHRVAWILSRGWINHEIKVCHSCDVPACCNPSHLFIGDDKANILDARDKGRMCIGIANANHKLDNEIIKKIRRYYATGRFKQVTLAKRFNVSQHLISLIVRREVWSHVL